MLDIVGTPLRIPVCRHKARMCRHKATLAGGKMSWSNILVLSPSAASPSPVGPYMNSTGSMEAVLSRMSMGGRQTHHDVSLEPARAPVALFLLGIQDGAGQSGPRGRGAGGTLRAWSRNRRGWGWRKWCLQQHSGDGRTPKVQACCRHNLHPATQALKIGSRTKDKTERVVQDRGNASAVIGEDR